MAPSQLSRALRFLPNHYLMSLPEMMSLPERKELVKITRVRSNPDKNLFLALQTPLISSKTNLQSALGGNKPISVSDYFTFLETEIFSSDLLSSIYLMLLRNYTLSSQAWYNQEILNRLASFNKEFSASQTTRSPSRINYSALFGITPNDPVTDLFPARPSHAKEVYKHLCSWKEKCSKQILFPKTSTKSMGRLASHNASNLYDLGLEYGEKISTEDVEYWYFRSGEYPEGPCEMRQAWFYNDLTPRTYYATGPSAHKWARYSQRIFNLLLDEFPCTHRFKRFRLDKIDIESWEHAMVYDYSSFTSKMSEHTPFLFALADFCNGTTIRLVDGPYGIVEVDMGDYLRMYATTVNEFPDFVIAEELCELLNLGTGDYYKHQCASMLGVNGNLASATALHGLYLSHLVGSFSKCSCVGDDAIGIFEVRILQGALEEGEIRESVTDGESHFVRCLQVLGDVHLGKSKVLRPVPEHYDDELVCVEERWTYLKRSLDRFPRFLELGFMPATPNLQVIHQEEATTRRMNFDATDKGSFVPRVATQCFNFVQSIFLAGYSTDEEVRSAYVILDYIYRELGLPRTGWLFLWSQFRDISASPISYLEHVTFLPAIGKDWEEFSFIARSHPLDHLAKLTLSEIGEGFEFRVPDVVSRFEPVDSNPETSTFTARMNAAIAYGCKVGVMQKSVRYRSVLSEDILSYLHRFLDRSTSVLYDVSLYSSCPDWLRDVLRE